MGFRRRLVDELETGQRTELSQVSGNPESLLTGAWATLKEVTSVEKKTRIMGIKITISGTVINPVYRILIKDVDDDAYRKLFPYGASTEVYSGIGLDFSWPLEIPKGANYKVEVYCDSQSGGTGQLNYLNIIEVGRGE